MRESLRRTKSPWSCLWAWAPLPSPDTSGVAGALLVLRQLSPALACVGILVFGCLPMYWIPPLLISSNWAQTQMYFAKMHFSKMG